MRFSECTESCADLVLPLEQRSGLLSASYNMHTQLATLKHYLKVVPFQYRFLDGETSSAWEATSPIGQLWSIKTFTVDRWSSGHELV